MTADPFQSAASADPPSRRGGHPELEIKLVATAGQDGTPDVRTLSACAAASGIDLGPVEELHQVDSYLDDERLRLTRAGAGLRIRQVGDQAVLCLKIRREQQGDVHHRTEFESAWTGPPPRSAAELPDEVRCRVQPLLRDGALRTVVVLRTLRSRWRRARSGESCAELCIDHVEVGEPGHPPGATFDELEIERSGDTPFAPWIDFAAELRQRFGLETARLDKLQRALALGRISLQPLRPAAVQRGMSLREAGLRVVQGHLLRMQKQEIKVLTRDGTRPVHKLRVASRRLRAALQTFGPAFADEEVASLRKTVRRTARAFGEVRDLDVLIAHLEGRRDELPAVLLESHDTTLRALGRRRHKRFRAGRVELSAPARIARLGDWQRALEDRSGDTRLDLTPPLEDTARRLLGEALDEVLDRASRLHPDAAATEVHALRLAMKQLRYTGESLTGAFDGRLDELLTRCSDLQTVLGEFNDAEVALEGLAALGRRRGLRREQRMLIGAWMAGQEQRRRQARARVHEAWRNFDPSAFRSGFAELLSDRPAGAVARHGEPVTG